MFIYLIEFLTLMIIEQPLAIQNKI